MSLTDRPGFLGDPPLPTNSGRHSAQSRARSRRRLRPDLERLEDLTAPATYTAATVSDLIADINAANRQGGTSTIALVAGNPFLLDTVNNTTDGATGLPVIAAKEGLTIVGNGATISRAIAAGTPAFRLFDVAAGASLTLRGVTLAGGLAAGSGVSAEGGAVYNQGTLVLDAVTVQGNAAQGDNGINRSPSQAAAGGGIYTGGVLTLEGGSKVQDNQVLGGHGADHNGGAGGDASGGGVYVAGGTVTLMNTSLLANTVRGGQGGLGRPSGSGPGLGHVPGPGGAGGAGRGGGLYVAAGTVTLTDCSLSANVAQGGQGGNGGGVKTLGGDGGDGSGGGLYAGGGTAILRNDAVTRNSARGGSGGAGVRNPNGQAGLGEGGGLSIESAAVVSLDASTQANVTGNTASTKDPNIHGPWRRS